MLMLGSHLYVENRVTVMARSSETYNLRW